MRRIGEEIQCASKTSGVSRADHAMSGYAASTRPTELEVRSNAVHYVVSATPYCRKRANILSRLLALAKANEE